MALMCVAPAVTPAPSPEPSRPEAPPGAGTQPGAGTPPAAEAPPPEALARARAIADDLTRALSSRLMAEMQAGGPVQAVKVCAEVAPSIAASRSDAATTVRRVSLKVRNPADAPDAFETRRLEEMETAQRQGTAPREVAEVLRSGESRTLRYLRPIVVGETCLKCHGPAEAIEPAVRSILSERYPGDRATGYRSGDLRGAVSVTIRLDTR